MTRKKAHKNLGTFEHSPFIIFFPNSVCVCVNHSLKTCLKPQLENSQEAQFSPILCPLQRQSQFSALDMELNTGAVHYGCWFCTGPQPSGGHICHKVNNNKKMNVDRSSECCWHYAMNNKLNNKQKWHAHGVFLCNCHEFILQIISLGRRQMDRQVMSILCKRLCPEWGHREWGHNAWSQWNCRHCHPATTHDPLVPGIGSQQKSEHWDNDDRNHELDKNVSKRTLTTLNTSLISRNMWMKNPLWCPRKLFIKFSHLPKGWLDRHATQIMMQEEEWKTQELTQKKKLFFGKCLPQLA